MCFLFSQDSFPTRTLRKSQKLFMSTRNGTSCVSGTKMANGFLVPRPKWLDGGRKLSPGSEKPKQLFPLNLFHIFQHSTVLRAIDPSSVLDPHTYSPEFKSSESAWSWGLQSQPVWGFFRLRGLSQQSFFSQEDWSIM